MFKKLFEKITPNTTILTPNRRLAAFLQNQYAVFEQSREHNIWATPDILPIDTWFKRCWQEFAAQNTQQTEQILPVFHQLLLFEQFIKQSAYGETLLQVSASAKLVQEAWRLVNQWELPLQANVFVTEDHKAFFYLFPNLLY